MQWNGGLNAGFTSGTPWIMVNPNYPEINVEQALSDPDSVFHYYRKLIALRKTHSVIVYGDYTPLLEDDPALCAYTRTLDGEALLVVCNFTDRERALTLPEAFVSGQILITNLGRKEIKENALVMLPYESVVIRVRQAE